MRKFFPYIWYQKRRHIITLILLPLSYLFLMIITIRRFLYRLGIFKVKPFNIPIMVVGNITVGGNGKTPMVIWLFDFLTQQGSTPGIVSRGYKGRCKTATTVYAHSDPKVVGDEAVLLASRCQCPVVIARHRPDAVSKLINDYRCDVIISDDGLQHYALASDIKILMVDGIRRWGNGRLLPAGPLRQPLSTIANVDCIVSLNVAKVQEYLMKLIPAAKLCHVTTGEQKALDAFKHQTVHAVAGIACPWHFFSLLQTLGLSIIEHPFYDHYPFSPQDLDFSDNKIIIMTEKDAIKCRGFYLKQCWYLAISAELSSQFAHFIAKQLAIIKSRKNEAT